MVLAYFTKVLAQRRYTLMQGAKQSEAAEEIRKNPDRYLSQMDFDIFDDKRPPDLSIMEDN